MLSLKNLDEVFKGVVAPVVETSVKFGHPIGASNAEPYGVSASLKVFPVEREWYAELDQLVCEAVEIGHCGSPENPAILPWLAGEGKGWNHSMVRKFPSLSVIKTPLT